MRRRTFVVAGIAALTAGCSESMDDDERPVAATLLTSYGIRGLDAYAYVAQEKGYFRAAGFEVTVEPGRDLATNLRRLQAGGPVFAAVDLTACLLAAATPADPAGAATATAANSGGRTGTAPANARNSTGRTATGAAAATDPASRTGTPPADAANPASRAATATATASTMNPTGRNRTGAAAVKLAARMGADPSIATNLASRTGADSFTTTNQASRTGADPSTTTNQASPTGADPVAARHSVGAAGADPIAARTSARPADAVPVTAGNPAGRAGFPAANPARSAAGGAGRDGDRGGGGISGFVFLAGIHQRTTAAILAPGGGGIGAPHDLSGKTLADMPGSSVRALFPTYARLAGIDAHRTTWIDATSQTMGDDLAQGRMAGIGDTVAGRRAFEAVTHGRTAVVLAYSDQLQDLYGDALATSTAYAKAEPGRARKFAAALLRGLADAIDDPAAAGVIMHKYAPSVAVDAVAAELTLVAPYIRSSAEGLPVGALDANRVARSIAVLQGVGQIAPGLTPDRFMLS